MSALVQGFRRTYGRGPLHLLGHLAAFGVIAFALDQIFSGGHVQQILEWYIGFALLHDLVLLPLYSALDRGARIAARRMPRRAGSGTSPPTPLINHVRVPAVISAILLLVYAPLITGVGGKTYRRYSGHPVEGYLRNWLLITAALFLASGVIYAVRARRR